MSAPSLLNGQLCVRGYPVEKYEGDWSYRYIDTKEAVSPENERPCRACGKKADPLDGTVGGADPCLGVIPGVAIACCGHGVADGYLQLTNGNQFSLAVRKVDGYTKP